MRKSTAMAVARQQVVALLHRLHLPQPIGATSLIEKSAAQNVSLPV